MDLYQSRVRALGAPSPEPAADPVETSPCPVCDHTQARARFAVDGVSARIVECERCGLGRFHPMFREEEIAGLYPATYYGASEGSRAGTAEGKFRPLVEGMVRLIAERHIAFLSQGLPAGARILDVGCGRGVILSPLADRGFEVHGVELSEHAVQGVDPRAHVRIAPDLALAGYPADGFDQIVIWHVLEHLLDPRATLEECARILAPDGRLIVAVPNFSSWQARWSGAAWFHLDAPRHLYHFPLPALRQLLERSGFVCARAHHFSLRQNPFGWIQSASNKWFPGVPNRLYSFLYRESGARVGLFERIVCWAVLAVGAVPALALSVLAAAARSGATVHVVARRAQRPGPPG